jgi:mRNA interferase RelE/StbE
MYRLEFSPGAQRAFRKLTQDIQERIDPVILALGQNPRPPNCKKLSGKESLWRVRAGDYRIVYRVFDDRLLVLVLNVGHRREIYR